MESMPGSSQDGERGHVCSEHREQKHGGAQRAAGEKIIFCAGVARGSAKGEDADVEDDPEVEEDNERGYHGAPLRTAIRASSPALARVARSWPETRSDTPQTLRLPQHKQQASHC